MVIAATTRSALSVISKGMRLAPLVVTISRATPRSCASNWAVSYSEPVISSLSFLYDHGGTLGSMAMRIFLACWIRASVSVWAWTFETARVSTESASTAKVRRSMMCLLGGWMRVSDRLPDFCRQVRAVELPVDGVELAVGHPVLDPLVQEGLERRFVLPQADADRELREDELRLQLPGW